MSDKFHSFLNLLGLSVGFAVCILIVLFVRQELSYDQFHENYDRLYKIVKKTEGERATERWSIVNGLIGGLLKENLANVEESSRYFSRRRKVSVDEGKKGIYASVTYVDPAFLEILSFFPKQGAEKPLDQPDDVALSTSMAKKLQVNKVGETVFIDDTPFRVSAILEDTPKNSSIRYQLLVPINHFAGKEDYRSMLEDWGTAYFDNLVLLTKGADVRRVEAWMNKEYHDPGKPASASDAETWYLQPMRDFHFSLDVNDFIDGKVDRQYIGIFLFIALVVMVCAAFNYTSMQLSQVMERVKEMGIRKVHGAGWQQVFLQLICESVLLVLIAFIVSAMLVEFSLPVFETMLSKKIHGNFLTDLPLMLTLLGGAMLVAFIASFYPAWMVSRLKVSTTLKPFSGKVFREHHLMSGIAVFQVVVFIGLICASGIVRRQLHFLQNKNLGFDKEHVLVLNMRKPEEIKAMTAMKGALENVPGVNGVSLARTLPNHHSGSFTYGDLGVTFYSYIIDPGYLEVMQMELTEGRPLNVNDHDSLKHVLINETAAKKLDIEDDPIGKKIKGNTIVGVVKDFHFMSKKVPVEAVMFRQTKDFRYGGLIVLRLDAGNREVLQRVRNTYQEIISELNMDFFFLEDRYDNMYRHETAMSGMMDLFAGLAVFIAVIGLLGLSGYSTKRRIKELGIRKVLGARVVDLLFLLNVRFIWFVVIASFLAVPVSYGFLDRWLHSFTYSISLSPVIFVLAVIGSMIIVGGAVSFYGVGASLKNPADTLKNE